MTAQPVTYIASFPGAVDAVDRTGASMSARSSSSALDPRVACASATGAIVDVAAAIVSEAGRWRRSTRACNHGLDGDRGSVDRLADAAAAQRHRALTLIAPTAAVPALDGRQPLP